MKALLHHLGLGDHIICNGLVRELHKIYGEMALFVSHKNLNNISFMFSDLDNLWLIPVDREADCFKFGYFDIINVSGNISGPDFDKVFYQRGGVDFQKKWDSFYLPRDAKLEKGLFDSLGLVENEYAFIHEWGNSSISDVLDMRNIRPLPELGGIFDFCYIIENAAEIHCMESSFKNLVEFLNVKDKKLYFHSCRRNSISASRLNWERK